MYLQNKYTTWYYNIINRAKLRADPIEYCEQHHIIPKSLGGSNYKDNLVKLTAREHFICHWLLTKMVSGSAKHKMAHACRRMFYKSNKLQSRYKINSRLYETLKANMAELAKGEKRSVECRQKMSKSAKIRCDKESPEIKQRRAAQLTAVNLSRKGIKKPYQIGENNVFADDKVKEKIQATNIEKYGFTNPALIPYTCEYCGSSGKGLAGYKRWHNINCKKKPINT
jgi:hypothetical protein